MSELREILAAWERLREDEVCVLPTLVHTEGSTYRSPGARMLVLPDAQKGGEKMSSDDAKEFADMYGKIVSKIKSLD